MKRETYLVLNLIFVFLSFISRAQNVNDVVEEYNRSVDRTGKLDSIVQIQVDMSQRSYTLTNSLISNDSSTITISVFGDNYSDNWTSGSRMDFSQLNISNWETKNIIKNHFHILICNDKETFKLMETNDSIFVIKKFTNDKEIIYEIGRKNYNLQKSIIKYNGNETTVTFSEFKMIEGLKVPTAIGLYSVIGRAETKMSNYRFTKIINKRQD